MHAHPDSKSWHEEFVKRSSGEQHVVNVTVNMDGAARPTTWLSNSPIIVKRSVGCKEVDSFVRRSLWQDNTRLTELYNSWDLSCEEEPIEWTAEGYEKIWDKSQSVFVQTCQQGHHSFFTTVRVLDTVRRKRSALFAKELNEALMVEMSVYLKEITPSNRIVRYGQPMNIWPLPFPRKPIRMISGVLGLNQQIRIRISSSRKLFFLKDSKFLVCSKFNHTQWPYMCICCGLFAPTQFHSECCGVFDNS